MGKIYGKIKLNMIMDQPTIKLRLLKIWKTYLIWAQIKLKLLNKSKKIFLELSPAIQLSKTKNLEIS